LFIFENSTQTYVKAEIFPADITNLPLKKDGWKFNWKIASKTLNCKTYCLRLDQNPLEIQGCLLLRIFENMQIMELLEIAPHNIGNKNKKYDNVAGCLIAFACRESFKLESVYRGFLSFESKTTLKKMYIEKYKAEHAFGNKMFIGPKAGIWLIDNYLNKTI
jgi:hypothetical protein